MDDKDNPFASFLGPEDANMSLGDVVLDFSKILAGYMVSLKESAFTEEQAFVLCRDLQETYFQFLFMGIANNNHSE